MLDYTNMPIEHIVVDGSNIATEGRSLPSLKQLEEAVAELRRDHPNAEITVIVDATFAHRIDPSELARFEQAAMRGEYVHPPAGAIGRGDAFLLRVAEKVDGTVLSNDSFQEFHGEHPWLFERGRLLGGTPVPGIGWIFSPRQPVRGPRSRQAVRETVQAKKRVTKAIAVATKEVVEPAIPSLSPPASAGRPRGRRGTGGQTLERPPEGSRDGGKPTPLAVNDPLAFISFIAEHPLGEQVEGEVEGYTSHGAVVRVGEMRCYVPLANLGDPPPRSAREVLKRHDRLSFVLTALDPQRRGAELALPGSAACFRSSPRRDGGRGGAPRAAVTQAWRRPARPGRGAGEEGRDSTGDDEEEGCWPGDPTAGGGGGEGTEGEQVPEAEDIGSRASQGRSVDGACQEADGGEAVNAEISACAPTGEGAGSRQEGTGREIGTRKDDAGEREGSCREGAGAVCQGDKPEQGCRDQVPSAAAGQSRAQPGAGTTGEERNAAHTKDEPPAQVWVLACRPAAERARASPDRRRATSQTLAPRDGEREARASRQRCPRPAGGRLSTARLGLSSGSRPGRD